MSSKCRAMCRRIERTNGVTSSSTSNSTNKTKENKKIPWRAYLIILFCLVGSVFGILSFFGLGL